MDMKLIDNICDNLIRQPKRYYKIDQLIPKEFFYQYDFYIREDFIVRNKFGIALKCSHYKPPYPCYKNNQTFPCVIYCHGTGGNRLECLEIIRFLLPLNITVVSFDFSGCGMSGGRNNTSGYNEKYDIGAVVKYIKECGHTSSIGLWGRTAGAVASILYAKEDPTISSMILDTPFSSLSQLIEENYIAPMKLPKIVSTLYMLIIKNKIKMAAHFSVSSLDIASAAQNIYIPAIFVHDKQDKFILNHHSDQVAFIDGERSPSFYNSAALFFSNILNPPRDIQCVYDEDDIRLVTIPLEYNNKSDNNSYNNLNTTVMRTMSSSCFRLQQQQEDIIVHNNKDNKIIIDDNQEQNCFGNRLNSKLALKTIKEEQLSIDIK
ncbi:hypothetical protein PPL_03268 [Heterostelium album PN500]|uniref:AB hydrolase-1 domain-containing protein n=1 Tax=Heterostelium pallidum (strain ATCC 26659 / Pp 5 / PN500) TaxID=670386 RepID=D3B4E5_HETP5|nr:hypothetical protein PPL_03268 [Heterostelium album PN500]EFA84193.1 hypothetical protein PPL_03268 [Heterostelium album PN500]|eukprot:XP_020436310.1 hypothetical protein PPL_03268 [Heterostelium album PN500]